MSDSVMHSSKLKSLKSGESIIRAKGFERRHINLKKYTATTVNAIKTFLHLTSLKSWNRNI